MKPKSNNNDFVILSDSAIVKEICSGMKQMRLNKNLSQDQVAVRSGLHRVTISRMEAGRAATLLTVVQVLRALDRLEVLQTFREEPEISPIQLLKAQERTRKKASPKKASQKTSQ